MSKPTAFLEISYEDPTATPTWVDESAYLRSFNVNRGRQFELDQQQAGRLSFVADNRVGRFDPGNTAGAHYPNVLPMRRVRLSTSLNATVPETFTMRSSNVGSTAALRAGDGVVQLFLFTGFIESISETWMLANGDAAVTIQCVDAFKVFNLSNVTYAMFGSGVLDDDGYPGAGCGNGDSNVYVYGIKGQVSGQRINQVLDCIDWPTDMRNTDPGTVWIAGRNTVGINIPLDDVNALSYLLDVADTEGGNLFIDNEGRVRFIDANHLSVPSIVTEIYGGQTGEIGYLDAVVGYDDTRLYNSISVMTGDQGPALASDATSIASFYERRLSKTYLETQLPGIWGAAWFNDAPTRAAALLAKYKDPVVRITSMSLSPMHSADWLAVLSHDLGDYVRVKKRPATADVIDQTLRIEGISVSTGSFDLDNWNVEFKLSA